LPKNFDFFKVMRKRWSIGISNHNLGKYLHEQFYKRAERSAFDEIYAFLMDGKLIILLCENELSEYSGRFEDVGKIV
jgi:hypothetical protein